MTALGPRLVVVGGPHVGTIVDLSEENTAIGRRSTSALVLADASVSRDHCVVRRAVDGLVLEDLGSRHGTLVNGARVKVHRLVNGDRIRIGESDLVFVGGPEIVQATSAEIVDDDVLGTATRELTSDDSMLSHPEIVLAAKPGSPGSSGLEALLRVSEAVRAAEAPTDLARSVLEVVLDILPAGRAGLLVRNIGPDGSPGAIRLLEAITRDGRALRISRVVAERVMTTRRSLLSNTAASDPDTGPSPSLREDAVSSVMCVPLPLAERTIGVLYADSTDASARFEERHLDLATAIAAVVAMPLAIALEQAAGGVATGAAAPAATTVPASWHSAILLLPDAPLDLLGALALRLAMSRIDRADTGTLAILLDYGQPPPTEGSLTDACLDRLAILPDGHITVASATQAPSLARLAALVATSHDAPDRAAGSGPRAWLTEILARCAVASACCERLIVEPVAADPPATDPIERLLKDLPGGRSCGTGIRQRTSVIGAGLPPILSLDGSGPMGGSPRGTVFLSDSPDVVARKIRAAKTDASTVLDPEADLSPQVASLLLLLSLLRGEPMGALLARLAGKGYGVLKSELAEAAEAFLAPIRERREALRQDAGLAARLARGSAALDESARKVASELSRIA